MIKPIVQSVAENIKKLMRIKASIKHAIELKNVPVHDSTTLESYADKILEIEEGDIFSENYKIYKCLLRDSYTNAYSLFANKTFTNLDLSIWDTKYITNMSKLFIGCTKLESVNMSGWNTSRVGSMSSMFKNCKSLTSLDVNNLDISNVTNMSSMFYNCESLKTLDLSNWNTDGVYVACMFWNCYYLQFLDISNFTVTEESSGDYVDTGATVSIGNILSNCYRLHELRLDNCSRETIIAIVFDSGFPTNKLYTYDENEETIEVPRCIYCKEENAEGLIAPENWTFIYV